ncbi:VWA domain-containing protein [Actinomyces sp. AC-19-1]|nr:SpaA isopeptide-forming pilin-related protein [Actinomyces sp. 217892]MCL3789384.1 VWA domain-containing protein [Actinomyces sp. 187325]MCL3793777.1 VWA domain-containing protein [Actinomyces sp. 217892]
MVALAVALGTGGLALAAAPLALGEDESDGAGAVVGEAAVELVATDPAPGTADIGGAAEPQPEVGAEPGSASGDGDAVAEEVGDVTWTVTQSEEAVAQDGAEADKEAVAEPATALRAAPQAGYSESVVVVSVVGARAANGTKLPLPGVRLTGTLGNGSVFYCTSDAEGDCAFTVPSTGSRQPNRNQVMTVTYTEDDVPAGWYANTRLAVKGRGDWSPVQSVQYRMTTPRLEGGRTYRSGASGFTGSGLPTTTGGWQASIGNPSFPQQCGLKVAIVMDLSSSVRPEHVEQAKRAANSFVDVLTGTPSSIGVYTFGSVAPAAGMTNLSATAVSTPEGAQRVKQSIASWTHLTQGTNWDRGLSQLQGQGYSVVMFITDGLPTFYGTRPYAQGNTTRFDVTEEAIASANALKSEGARVVAFGVGSGVSSTAAAANLRAISGQSAGSDYFQTTDYAVAAEQLKALASGACRQTVTVVKQTVPYTYDASTSPALADGWTFEATTAGGATFADGTTNATGVTGAAESQTGTGATEFRFEVPWASATGTMTLTETQQPGYSLVQQGGANAACYKLSDDGSRVPISVTDAADGGFTIPVSAQNQISCYVINREPAPVATVTVSKKWMVDGQEYIGGVPEGLGMTASLKVNDADTTWGETSTGHHVDDTLTIAEATVIKDMPGCELTGSSLSGTGLDQVIDLDLAKPEATVTLTAESNSYTLTNTVTCTQTLSLDKKVDNSASVHPWATQAMPEDWTLTATTGSTPALNGTGSVEPTQVAAGDYTLAESAQATLALPAEAYAAGTWQCSYTDGAGGEVALNGTTVTVPRGRDVACTITNTLKAFPIAWEKVDESGAPLTGAEWTITRTGMNDASVDLPSSNGSYGVEGLPIGTYTLTETKAPVGYTKAGDITFTVSADGTVSGLPAKVTNTKRDVPTLPLTGGLGTDMLLVGSGLLIAAALAAEAMRRRRQQTTSQ